jgi:hypothetical protein
MKFNITRVVVIMAAVALIATLSACCPGGAPSPTGTPRPLQSGSQPTGDLPLQPQWGMTAGTDCTDPHGGRLPAECVKAALAVGVSVCAHEDGNPDGHPCLWVDPGGTGVYYVDSSEYRRD